MMPMRQIGIICDRLEMPSGSRGRLTYPAAVREQRLSAGDDLPRVFTPRQCNGIRKVARKFGYPRDQWWDFVHETWLKVAGGWFRVPRVEPSMSRYIFRIARNLAIDLFRRFEGDAMTGAVVFSCLPEWAREDQDEQPGEDRPGTPEVGRLPIEQSIRAEQLRERAGQRDREAAEWMMRLRVHGESGAEIAADAGAPRKRIYQRVSRLEEKLAELEAPEEPSTAPARGGSRTSPSRLALSSPRAEPRQRL
jgi:RNA polymerase sigma factor (sigma-70 family)